MDHIQDFKSDSEGRRRKRRQPQEWKVVSVRECPVPETLVLINTPEAAARYWKDHITTAPQFNPDCECLVVLILNTKLRVKGHHIVSLGSLNESVAQPREVFRIAVMAAAFGIVLMHNHPSGETAPSDADCRVTRIMRQAGEVLRIHVQDHVIVGHERHFSFREAGML